MPDAYEDALLRATEDELEHLITSLSKYGQSRKQALELIRRALGKVAEVPQAEELPDGTSS